jgi:hypothetical protein
MSALTSAIERSWSRLLVGKAGLQLRLPGCVLAEGPTTDRGPSGIQRDQVAGELRDRLADAAARPCPLAAAEAREGRGLSPRVAADAVDLLDRDPDPVGTREVELQEVALLIARSARRPADEASVAGDPVVHVDDRITGLETLQEVARHDATERPWTPDADRAEELAVGDQDEPVGSAREAAVEASGDERHAAGGCGLVQTVDGCGDDVRLGQDLLEPRRLVGGKDHPGALTAPALDGGADAADRGRRHGRLVPAERIAAGRRAFDLRLPAQLQGSRGAQGRLPSARRQVRLRPPLGQLGGRLELSRSLRGLCLQGGEGRLDLVGLVDDEDRVGDVVEAGGRGEDAAPDLGRVAQLPGLDEAFVIGGEALREPRHDAAEARLEQRAALVGLGGQAELTGRHDGHGLERSDAPLVGRVEGADRFDLVAEPLEADRQRLAWREAVDDAAASGELAAAGDLGHRFVAQVHEAAEEPVLGQPDPGSEDERLVLQVVHGQRPLTSAWTPATRIRASPACQSESAATRAAVSSRTSSERS